MVIHKNIHRCKQRGACYHYEDHDVKNEEQKWGPEKHLCKRYYIWYGSERRQLIDDV